MSNIPTQTKLWYIQYPVKIDGVTDDQVQEWAQHCSLYAAINTETTDENGYPIYEFQSYLVPALLVCINRMLQSEGLTYTEDDLSFRMVDLNTASPTIIVPANLHGGITFNDDDETVTINCTGQVLPYGTDARIRNGVLWANTVFDELPEIGNPPFPTAL